MVVQAPGTQSAHLRGVGWASLEVELQEHVAPVLALARDDWHAHLLTAGVHHLYSVPVAEVREGRIICEAVG